MNTSNFIRDLGDGLILRRSSSEDIDALAQFNAAIHGEDELDAIRLAVWTRDLMRGNHPTFGVGDNTIVEDTRSGKIVSSMNLISQTWDYEGIPFKVGRPELVGTDPAYRNRGLVRAQFDVVHAWSQERKELVQGITGIPYYYRQFGYEMAMNLGGSRLGYAPHVPRLEKDQAESYFFRLPEESDLLFLAQLYQQGCRRSLVSCVRDAQTWHYEVFGKSPENVNGLHYRIIVNTAGERVGYLAHTGYNGFGGKVLTAAEFEIVPRAAWLEISQAAARYLWATAHKYAENSHAEVSGFGFRLHVEHPVYTVMKDLLPRERPPYAWYLRVPDMPIFLSQIKSVLEARLAASALAGHTGTLDISFYRAGVRLTFQEGCIAEIAGWKPAPKAEGQVAFPGLTFLHILFGYRTLEEIMHIFPDCWVADDLVRGLLQILFPKKPSNVLALA
ncbi:MAG TPA: GNAT family N-acetyltransferase [Anaerolineaceae bacterium]|nr:GNAT family N-acetyltransferase [Anaerolineaceae bacterium]